MITVGSLHPLWSFCCHYPRKQSVLFFLDRDSETTAQPITLLEKGECEMREQGCFYVVQLGKAGQG